MRRFFATRRRLGVRLFAAADHPAKADPIQPTEVIRRLQLSAVEAAAVPKSAPSIAESARSFLDTVRDRSSGSSGIDVDWQQLTPTTAIELLALLHRFQISKGAVVESIATWLDNSLDLFTPTDVLEACRRIDSPAAYDFWTSVFLHRPGVIEIIRQLPTQDLTAIGQVAAAHSSRHGRSALLLETVFELVEAAQQLSPHDFVVALRIFAHHPAFSPRVVQICRRYTRGLPARAFAVVVGAIATSGIADKATAADCRSRFLALRREWTSEMLATSLGLLSLFPGEPPGQLRDAVEEFVKENSTLFTAAQCADVLNALTTAFGEDVGPSSRLLSSRGAAVSQTVSEKAALMRALAFIPDGGAMTLWEDVKPLIETCSTPDIALLLDAFTKLGKFPDEPELTRLARRAREVRQGEPKVSIRDLAAIVYGLAMGGHQDAMTYAALATRVMAHLKFASAFAQRNGQAKDERMMAVEMTPHDVSMLLHGFQRGSFAFSQDPRLFQLLASRALAMRTHYGVKESCYLMAVAKGLGDAGDTLYRALVAQIRAAIETLSPSELRFVAEHCSRIRTRDIQLFSQIAKRLHSCCGVASKADTFAIITVFETEKLLASFPGKSLQDIVRVHAESFSNEEAATAAFWMAETDREGTSTSLIEELIVRAGKVTAPRCLAEVAIARQDRTAARQMAEKVKSLPPKEIIETIGATKLARTSMLLSDPHLMTRVAEALALGRQSLDASAMCSVLSAAAANGTASPALFRAFGKKIADSVSELSAPEVAACLKAYASCKVMDDYTVRTLFRRVGELKTSIGKNEDHIASVALAKTVFSKWAEQAEVTRTRKGDTRGRPAK